MPVGVGGEQLAGVGEEQQEHALPRLLFPAQQDAQRGEQQRENDRRSAHNAVFDQQLDHHVMGMAHDMDAAQHVPGTHGAVAERIFADHLEGGLPEHVPAVVLRHRSGQHHVQRAGMEPHPVRQVPQRVQRGPVQRRGNAAQQRRARQIQRFTAGATQTDEPVKRQKDPHIQHGPPGAAAEDHKNAGGGEEQVPEVLFLQCAV